MGQDRFKAVLRDIVIFHQERESGTSFPRYSGSVHTVPEQGEEARISSHSIIFHRKEEEFKAH